MALNDKQFLHRRIPQVSGLVADLADIAVSVHAADRMSARQAERQRIISVTLPVRHPEGFNNPDIVERLQRILFWYTGDKWTFRFNLRKSYGRLAERQTCFKTDADGPVEVALLSGGLDSFAGFYNRWLEEPERRFTFFGTGGNKIVHDLQQDIADSIARGLIDRTKLIVCFSQPIPVLYKGTNV